MSENMSPLRPSRGSGAACSHSSAATSHGWSGPAPRIMVGRGRVCFPPPLERDGAVPLCGGLRCARGCTPPAPFARPLRTHYTGLPRGHGAAPDDPRWEEGVL